MATLLAILIGCLYAAGVYLMLRRSLFKLILGLVLLSHGANLLIFTAAGLTRAQPPLVPLLREHVERARDGERPLAAHERVELERGAVVVERVGRAVEDAHHERPGGEVVRDVTEEPGPFAKPFDHRHGLCSLRSRVIEPSERLLAASEVVQVRDHIGMVPIPVQTLLHRQRRLVLRQRLARAAERLQPLLQARLVVAAEVSRQPSLVEPRAQFANDELARRLEAAVERLTVAGALSGMIRLIATIFALPAGYR